MARTAIITGSAQGIGKAIAIRLAEDGYDICVNDISANKSAIDDVVEHIRSLGRKSIGIVADVTSRAEVDNMIKESVSELGPLTTMIANAIAQLMETMGSGIAQVKPMLDISEDDIQRMFSVNVFGLHNCYTASARQFIAQGPPSAYGCGAYKIIGASSIAAFQPCPLLSHYCATKWAVRGLTQSFAAEMKGKGITVNAYAPGIIGTNMWDEIDEAYTTASGNKKGSMFTSYNDKIVMGRTGAPDDVAGLVSFLSGKDSDYMTGNTLVVDGGLVFH